MNPAAILNIAVKADASGAIRGLKDVDRQASVAGRSMNKLAASGEKSLRRLKVAAAGAAAGLIVLGKESISTASDINESLTKNQVLFGKYAKSVEQFSNTSAKSLGISKAAALEATGVFGNLFRALGLAKEPAAGLSTSLVKLAADMASFNNASPAEVLEALRAGIVGETEPLRKFGVNITDAALRTEAMAQGLTKTTKNVLNPHQRALAATALIYKQTTVAQGDFGRTSSGLANQQRILKAEVSDLQAELGAKLLPTLVKAANWTTKFVQQMRDGTGAGGRFAAKMGMVADAVRPIVKFFADHPQLIAGAVAAWAAYKAAAIGAAIAAGGALGPVTAAIAALSYAGYQLGKNWQNLWQGAKAAAEGPINAIIDKINDLIASYNAIPVLPDVDKIGGVNTGGGGSAEDQLKAIQKSAMPGHLKLVQESLKGKTKFTKSDLMKLWVNAGGDASVANEAAAIALAESGGNAGARNKIGATGLWQIYNGKNTSMGLKDPVANARAAVQKYNAAGGFTPWTVYTGADTGPGGGPGAKTYQQYLGDAAGGAGGAGLGAASAGKQTPMDRFSMAAETIGLRQSSGEFNSSQGAQAMIDLTTKALAGKFGKLGVRDRLNVVTARREAQKTLKENKRNAAQRVSEATVGRFTSATDLVDLKQSAGVFNSSQAAQATIDTTTKALAGKYGKLSSRDRLSVIAARRQAQATIKENKLNAAQRMKDTLQAGLDQRNQQNADALAALQDYQRSYGGSGFDDAGLALAGLTADTSDDRAVYQGRYDVAGSRLMEARASGNRDDIAYWAGQLKENSDAIANLTAATEDMSAKLQEQLDQERQAKLEAQRRANTSESNYATLAKAIGDIANGQIGGKVGLGFQTPSFAGGGKRY